MTNPTFTSNDLAIITTAILRSLRKVESTINEVTEPEGLTDGNFDEVGNLEKYRCPVCGNALVVNGMHEATYSDACGYELQESGRFEPHVRNPLSCEGCAWIGGWDEAELATPMVSDEAKQQLQSVEEDLSRLKELIRSVQRRYDPHSDSQQVESSTQVIDDILEMVGMRPNWS